MLAIVMNCSIDTQAVNESSSYLLNCAIWTQAWNEQHTKSFLLKNFFGLGQNEFWDMSSHAHHDCLKVQLHQIDHAHAGEAEARRRRGDRDRVDAAADQWQLLRLDACAHGTGSQNSSDVQLDTIAVSKENGWNLFTL